MQELSLNKRIIDVLRRHCGSQSVSGLLRELRKTGVLEPSGDGSAGRAGRSAQHPGGMTQGEVVDQFVTLCQTLLPEEKVPPVLVELGDVFKETGELQRAVEMYSLVVSHEGGSGTNNAQRMYRAEAFLRRGEVHSILGNWNESRMDLLKSRSMYIALKQKVAVGRVDNILGTIYAEWGHARLARRFFQKALHIFEENDEKELIGIVLMNFGILLNIRGQYLEAIEKHRRALSFFEQLGDVRRQAELHHNIGMAYLQRKQNDEALNAFNRSYHLASQLDLRPVMASALLAKAHVVYGKPDHRVAMDLAAQAIEQFEICGDRLGAADGYKLKGMIHRDMKEYELATSFFQTSLRLNRELHNDLNVAETSFELGLLEQRRRKIQEAIRAFTEAREIFRHIGAADNVRKAEAELNLLGVKCGVS